MTDSGRLYALLLALVIFFLSWVTVVAHPWQKAAVDPQVAALAQRRAALQHEALVVRRVLDRRWAAYRVALTHRRRLIAAAQVQARRAAQVVVVPSAQLASVSSPAPPTVVAPPATTSHTS